MTIYSFYFRRFNNGRISIGERRFAGKVFPDCWPAPFVLCGAAAIGNTENSLGITA
jgi:hypothetical protein